MPQMQYTLTYIEKWLKIQLLKFLFFFTNATNVEQVYILAWKAAWK